MGDFHLGMEGSKFEWELRWQLKLQHFEDLIFRPSFSKDHKIRTIFWHIPEPDLGFEMPDYGNDIPAGHLNIHDHDTVWENVPMSEVGQTYRNILQARKEYDDQNPKKEPERDLDDERKYGGAYWYLYDN